MELEFLSIILLIWHSKDHRKFFLVLVGTQLKFLNKVKKTYSRKTAIFHLALPYLVTNNSVGALCWLQSWLPWIDGMSLHFPKPFSVDLAPTKEGFPKYLSSDPFSGNWKCRFNLTATLCRDLAGFTFKCDFGQPHSVCFYLPSYGLKSLGLLVWGFELGGWHTYTFKEQKAIVFFLCFKQMSLSQMYIACLDWLPGQTTFPIFNLIFCPMSSSVSSNRNSVLPENMSSDTLCSSSIL